jgi:hypothetical protein
MRACSLSRQADQFRRFVLAITVTLAKHVNGCSCQLVIDVTSFLRIEDVLDRVKLAHTQRSATDSLDKVVLLFVQEMTRHGRDESVCRHR